MVSEELKSFRQMYTGFTKARVILTANNLGIFDRLKSPVSAKGIAKALRINLRATEILLDALTGIGLLVKSKAGNYRNTAISRRYLVKGSPSYQGDIVKHASTMWEGWSALDTVVRTGRPSRHTRDNESVLFKPTPVHLQSGAVRKRAAITPGAVVRDHLLDIQDPALSVNNHNCLVHIRHELRVERSPQCLHERW